MTTGSICASFLTQSYQLPVLDTMFIRKKYRGKEFGLHILEDFVDSFTEEALGLRYPLSSLMYTGKWVVKNVELVLGATFDLIFLQNIINLHIELLKDSVF